MRYKLLIAAIVLASCTEPSAPSWTGPYRLQSINGASAPWADLVQRSDCASQFAVDSAVLVLGEANGPNLRFREYGRTLTGDPFPCGSTTVIVEFSTFSTSGDALTITSGGSRFDHGSRDGTILTMQAATNSDSYRFARE